jgi:hypothetical protein
MFDLGGNLHCNTSNAISGPVLLSTNSLIDFPGGNAVLRFANSSAVGWTPGMLLVISNWCQLPGCADHIFFGTDATGLTAAQLAQIRFLNPIGLDAGTYFAQLNSNGELVPAARPTLSTIRNGFNLIFTWSGSFQLQSATNVAGPYLSVTGATSPYTNDVRSTPQRFFRLVE